MAIIPRIPLPCPENKCLNRQKILTLKKKWEGHRLIKNLKRNLAILQTAVMKNTVRIPLVVI
jgi:hypothetical protein